MTDHSAETTQWFADVLTIWLRRREMAVPVFVTHEFVSATVKGIEHRKLNIELRMSILARPDIRRA